MQLVAHIGDVGLSWECGVRGHGLRRLGVKRAVKKAGVIGA
jgi:hypothetical protein